MPVCLISIKCKVLEIWFVYSPSHTLMHMSLRLSSSSSCLLLLNQDISKNDNKHDNKV